MSNLQKQYIEEVGKRKTYISWLEDRVRSLEALTPAAVEPWDGLFVGCRTVYRHEASSAIADTGMPLAIEEVGLSWDTFYEAVTGYA